MSDSFCCKSHLRRSAGRPEEPSPGLRPPGGVTFEVQHLFGEDFSRGLEVKAFTRSVIIDGCVEVEILVGELADSDFGWQSVAQSTDGIFDPAFLPRRMGVTEVGCDATLFGEFVVQGELGSIIEGDGLSQSARKAGEEAIEGVKGGF